MRLPPRTTVFFLPVLLASGLALGGEPDRALAAADARLAELSWLAGTWAGEISGIRMEEHWTLPDGGLVLGLHRDVRPQGRAFFEYLRIESRNEGIFYVASPGGRPGVAFEMVEHSKSHAVFENPEHDFPQRIVYRREGDVLIARTESISDPEARKSEWRWRLRTPARAASSARE